MTIAHPQYRTDGSLAHFLDFDGLSRETLTAILDTAESLAPLGERRVRTVPLLRGRTVANLFFENSTRTRTAFELAAKRLSADVLNIDLVSSSTAKGESLLDTLRVLESLQCDMFVVRHAQSGAARFIARHVAPSVAVINGGDGQHAHPTQGLLDVFTIRRHKPDFANLTVVLIGDIVHSRVARSDLAALSILGTGEIRVVGPRTLVPGEVASLGGRVMSSLDDALVGADVVMGLRLQRERMDGAAVPSSGEFFKHYGLTPERLALAKPDAIVMHPGPTNRGVEIAAEVADGRQSVILEQVSAGLAVRMAVMSMVLGNRAQDGARASSRSPAHEPNAHTAAPEGRS